MKKLDNSALVPGMVVARDFMDPKSGLLIIGAKTVLTPEMIRKLERYAGAELYVQDMSSEIQEEYEQRLSEKIAGEHERVVNRARNLLSHGQNQAPELGVLEGMVGDIQSQIDLNSNVLLNLSHMRNFDDYLFSHVVNVSMLALLIGRQLHLDEAELKELGLTALLHDFGMTKLEYSIYDHTRELTLQEREQIKQHPFYGVELVQQSGSLSEKVLSGIMDHHERLDGSGYPRQLKGADISFYGKIIAVADVYDACISFRKYRKPQTPRQALKNLLGESHLFDLEILRAFVAAMAIYPIGSIVRLNTGYIAKVVGCNPNEPFRPDVRVLVDPRQQKLEPSYRLKLNEEANVRFYIEETLEEEQLSTIQSLLEE